MKKTKLFTWRGYTLPLHNPHQYLIRNVFSILPCITIISRFIANNIPASGRQASAKFPRTNRRYAFLAKHSLVALSGVALFVLLVLFISGIKVSAASIVFLLIAVECFMLFNELYYLLFFCLPKHTNYTFVLVCCCHLTRLYPSLA